MHLEEHRVIKAELPNGAVVQVEARAPIDPEAKISAAKVLSFEGVVDSVQAIAASMTKALEAVKPDKATVEFGVDVGVESGGLTALIVKGKGNATLTITLEWEGGGAKAA